ncbi:hypothetical protein ACOME3_009321 [Neoechinorhynchus agilis]
MGTSTTDLTNADHISRMWTNGSSLVANMMSELVSRDGYSTVAGGGRGGGAVSSSCSGTGNNNNRSSFPAGGNRVLSGGSKASGGSGDGGDKAQPPTINCSNDDREIIAVMATKDIELIEGLRVEKTELIAYKDSTIIGNGSFGIVYKAKLVIPFNDTIAIKKVLQDKHFKNRELEIMRQISHPNIVSLSYFFFSSSGSSDKKRSSTSTNKNSAVDIYLNLILEYVPETAHRITRCYSRAKESIPQIYIRLYIYQLLRAVGYLHQKKICHRDIKPHNLLICPERSILKLCDFGSAKVLTEDSVNVSYICSRYYRAPELIFGAVRYSCSIDTWSIGCVLAELLLGRPVFPGDSGVNQLVEIIKVLGTPSAEQIKTMNPHYECFRFPQIKSSPWATVFPGKASASAVDLVSKLLQYTPNERLLPFHALTHKYFSELREKVKQLPNGKELPPLFNFTQFELSAFDNDPNRENLIRIITNGNHFDVSRGQSQLASSNQTHSRGSRKNNNGGD